MPVGVAVTALMVPEEKIKKINAIQQVLTSLLMIGSPAIGTYLLSIFSIQQIYWLDVISFIPPAIVLLFIKIPKVSPNNKNNKGKNISFKKDFGEGLKYIKTSGLSSVFFMFAIANFIVVPIFSLLPLLVVNYHSGTAIQYGITEIMFQVGLLFGSFVLIVSKRKSTMKSVVTFGVLLSVCLLFMALVPKGIFWLFYITNVILSYQSQNTNNVDLMRVAIEQLSFFIIIIFLFYSNYLFLIPRYLSNKKYIKYSYLLVL